MSSFSHWYNSIFHTLHAPRPPWRIHNPRAQPRPPRASFFPGSPSPSSRVTWLGAEVSYGVKASKPGYSITLLSYSTSLGCRRQPSLACHAWNHGKSPKSSPLSQQCRFHCHTWSAGESHYCVNSKGFTKFGTHTNEESDEYQQKWQPLSDFVGLCSKYIAIPYGSMAFILKNLTFLITRCF